MIFLLVLAAVLKGLQRFQVFDLGSGNARAKDGDSLELNGTEVRLHGIDAPEYNQSCGSPEGEYNCGREAGEALAGLLRGQTISCQVIDRDSYGRAVSVCRNGNLEINREMVRRGWAVAYLRHSLSYVAAQNEAKAAARGIWRGTFEMPETFRSRHRQFTGDAAGIGSGGNTIGD